MLDVSGEMKLSAKTDLTELSSDVMSQLNALDDAIATLADEGRQNSGDLSRLAAQLAKLADVFEAAMERRTLSAANEGTHEQTDIA